MPPTTRRRILLVSLVALSGCAVVFPKEQGPITEILSSRYVTDEQRQAVADLNSPEMNAAIAEARK